MAAILRKYNVNREPEEEDEKFPNNKIRTAKYTCLTFFPLNLFHQFSKMANLYFLLLTFMELIPEISNGGFVTMALPLAFVVGVSMIKDCFEDSKRHASDD